MEQNSWGWSDRLSLSYEPMDETHKEFVELCAALSEDNPATFVARLDALIVHSIAHFEQENQWMTETAFPPAGCHRQEHEAVLEVMQEVRRRVELGETDLATRLAEELPLWFEHHVDTMDNMLARFMASNPEKLADDAITTAANAAQSQPA
ncbi:MAG: hemerythrin domain-containing protein [Pseudomonadota bacterium]